LLTSVGIGETEVTVQPVADVVAVQQVSVLAEGQQTLLDHVGDRRLAGARQARQPQHRGLLSLERRS
jgi:hypothetical protein